MAEATVESPPAIYFCHECMRDVRPNIPAFTCSRCNGGFIEEMESDSSSGSRSNRLSMFTQSSADSHNSDSVAQFAELLRNSGVPPWHHSRYSTLMSAQSDDADSEDDDLRGVAPSAVFHFSSGDPNQQPFQGIISYVLQRLSNDIGGRSPLILHSNPADYVWGAGGLDAIISQLLNHLETTGAPPAQREKIDNLSWVTIDQNHVDNSAQCSICMDDFEYGMEVRKLPCDHLYHSECIVRWLEMHGTCPVCRKDLNGEDTTTMETDFPSSFHLNTSGNTSTASTSSPSNNSMELAPSSSSSSSMECTPSSSFSDP